MDAATILICVLIFCIGFFIGTVAGERSIWSEAIKSPIKFDKTLNKMRNDYKQKLKDKLSLFDEEK